MRILWTLCLLTLTSIHSLAQNRPAYVSPQSAPEPNRVYFSAPGLVLPQLAPPQPLALSTAKCRQKLTGSVTLFLVVDTQGHASIVYFDTPLGNDLDRFALALAEADTFTPGALNGSPVPVARLLDVQMEACIDQTKDASGKKIPTIRLRAQPRQDFSEAPEPDAALYLKPTPATEAPDHTYKVGKRVSAPKPLKLRDAEFSEYARRNKISGVALVGFTVDAHGMPQDPRILRSIEPSLDQNALAAISGYRFTPAMKDGNPVPVNLTVEVSFRLY